MRDEPVCRRDPEGTVIGEALGDRLPFGTNVTPIGNRIDFRPSFCKSSLLELVREPIFRKSLDCRRSSGLGMSSLDSCLDGDMDMLALLVDVDDLSLSSSMGSIGLGLGLGLGLA
jgi:hypothetical protein